MMNQATPDPELAPASEAVWERPWSVEEIRRSSQSWSLAADAGLLQFLQEFSQQTISRTHEIKKQVDGLIRETKATDCRLHNVFNDFLMLSNTQFIENRVYDEEVEEPVLKVEAEKTEQEKTREQKEVDLIPKVQEAVNYGLQVLDSAFEQLDIKAGNSDSEEDDVNERVELILEPKDLYIDRPLPYLIGSKLFMEQEDVGLGELSSEGSVGSDRGSIVDSEEEKEEEESDDDFANQSDNDQNKHTTQMSDEEEDDDADLFADSEKEEDTEDIDENTKPKRPTSFADELAARIRGDSSRLGEEQAGDPKSRKTLKEKKERTPSDEEEDNLFAPPKLTDEDFSPFGSRGGLFSGGQGLFDNEDEESDLFRDTPQDRHIPAPINAESSSSKLGKKIPAGGVSVFLGDTDVFGASTIPVLKETQKPEQPASGKSSCVPAASGLFDDDDSDDFFTASCNKPSKTDKIKSTASIFDDDEGDLFKEKAAAAPEATVKQMDESKARAEQTVTLPSSKNLKLLPETKTQKSLFSDEEDSEDLFSSQNVSKSKSASLLPSKLPTSVSLFDDEDEEDNLFGTAAAKKQMPSLQNQSQEKAKPLEQPRKKASALLFSSDEEDQWSIADTQTKSPSDSKSKGELSNSGATQGLQATTVKKTSLFEEDDEDDLFAIAKDSQKKTQRVSLLFEDDTDNGSSLFGSPPTSAPPATMKKETAREAPPLLFSDEEETEPQFEVRPAGQKAKSPLVPSALQGTGEAEELEKEGLLTASAQEAIKHSDLFSPASPLDKGTKGRTKTVLSLFDEEEDKMEDRDSSCVPQTEVGKGPDPDARPKSTGVFQDEELLFSHKLQKDNDPDVDLFAGTKKTRLAEPSMGNLFGDDEDDDLFSSAKTQPVVPEKKKVIKKDHSVSSSKTQKHPESTQGSKEKSIWKPETAQDSSGLAPFKTKEPSTRIGKIQANLAINPAALLPGAAPQVSGAKPVSPELAVPSVEPGRSLGVDCQTAPPGPEEASVSFDLPAQTDTLHSVNKSRVKVRGKRRPQTRAARRLAAQESSEAEDTSVPGGPVTQLADGTIKPNGCHLHPRVASIDLGSEEAVAAAIPPRESRLAPLMDRSPFVMSLGQPGDEADLFDSEDIFSKGTRSQSTERAKPKVKATETSAHPAEGGQEKSSLFPALGEASSDDDLFQSIKPRPAKKTNPFPLLDDDDDLFTDQKGKKNEPKSSDQQDDVSKIQDIFEDDIFATEAIKPSQKKREKEKNLEPSLLDDNIDIFADLTLKPKGKSKKKVEAKSIFDDDMDDIFSSGLQTKTTKPKSRPAQTTTEPRSEHKVSNIFDDPLNAFGGQ
ncbi:PREDICTED: WASH complex subunit FAM21C isoform X2 [Chinchilla lanigera]|uniref:WASH complex subunit FAM21C isoform X2 n=1 Tax=Chinchilla lanigera TaxID=34839 RepID=UPI000696305C|nr:PREDICTED: WASH complex subunit FAM21C isoform X2 [Chinchilla lanigera]